MVPGINFFVKTHGLGNEYIVFDASKINFKLTDKAIKQICNIHFGIGSDGILLLTPSSKADFGFRVFNPDASEAEKSGNGLRIFCKFLYDYGYTSQKQFTVETKGGIVTGIIEKEVNGKAVSVTVEMGKATFIAKEVPVISDNVECFGEKLVVGGTELTIHCVSVGNPHCVMLRDVLDENEVKALGPQIETHPRFPNKINTQFAKVLSRSEVQILIWERGAGYTMASGSSSSAVACVLKKLGLVDEHVTVYMPGGTLKISVDKDYNIVLTGPVREIASGYLSPELLEDIR